MVLGFRQDLLRTAFLAQLHWPLNLEKKPSKLTFKNIKIPPFSWSTVINHVTITGGNEHSTYIPVFPVDRSHGKPAILAKGNGYRIPALLGMHFLTSALRVLEPRVDDDFIDRVNYYYTSTIIIMFAILVGFFNGMKAVDGLIEHRIIRINTSQKTV